jgi:hypothetical protein
MRQLRSASTGVHTGARQLPDTVELEDRSGVQRSSPNQSANEPTEDHLTADELHRLTLYKWRYMLESLGFRDWQLHQLMFLTWLRATSRVHG